MNTDIRIVLAAALFGSVGFFAGWGTAQIESEDFDCVNDYRGAIVVEKKGGLLIVSKDGCNYETVKFPALYKYSLGDTVCKSTTVFAEVQATMQERIKNEIEHQEMLKRIRNEY